MRAEKVPFRRITCCKRVVCLRCFATGVKGRVEADWLRQLGSREWLQCALQDCEDRVYVSTGTFAASTGQKYDDDAGSLVKRAACLRNYLRSAKPEPSPEALDIASAFHTDLIRNGCMEMNWWTSSVVMVLEMESKDGTQNFMVPVFSDCFVRGHRKDCPICVETYPDVLGDAAEDRASWEKLLVDFPRPWPLKVRLFPPSSVLPECTMRHGLDICDNCIAKYIKERVDSASRPVKCFTCDHIYTQKQVELLAGTETFQKQEKLQLTALLDGQDGFLWCISPVWQNGQIHDVPGLDDSIPEANMVECNHCGFLMCFKHRRAWHAGMSCREFDNFCLPRDRSIAQTERFLRQQTKRCPKCNVSFMKASRCFHMTCSRPNCRFEFCWKCLVNWEDVRRRGPMAHGEGCDFRNRSEQEPHMLLGNTIEEARRRY